MTNTIECRPLLGENGEILSVPFYRFVTTQLLMNLCLIPLSFSQRNGEKVCEILNKINEKPDADIELNDEQIALIMESSVLLESHLCRALVRELLSAKPRGTK